jgi:adenosine deaminase
VQTGAVPELARHPLKLYHDLGLRVTVNTDNRLITDTSVSRELWVCHTQLGLSLSDIKHIILNGFKAAFLPFHQRQDYVRRIVDELARFREDGSIEHDEEDTPERRASLHPATV